MSNAKKRLQVAVYWLIHMTWALPSFLVGAVVALALLLSWHRPYIFGFAVYFKVGFVHGSGCEFGPFFVISEDCSESTRMKCHEHGHGIQALWWGPLMLLVICVPSLIRFHYRNYKEKSTKKKKALLKITQKQYDDWLSTYPSYDDIWFEHQATELGLKYFA